MGVWKEIRCDGPRDHKDCFSNRNVGPMGYESARYLRALAKREGWLVANGDEICPVCRTTPSAVECPVCKGFGRYGTVKCWNCNGSGREL